VERCAVILHLIDGTEDDVVGAYRMIRHELADYGHGLADKPEIVGLNKIDAIDPDAVVDKCRALARAARPGTSVLPLSGVSGAGGSPGGPRRGAPGRGVRRFGKRGGASLETPASPAPKKEEILKAHRQISPTLGGAPRGRVSKDPRRRCKWSSPPPPLRWR